MTKGQGLVETAIIAPVVIFMLIGVLEVGWLLRNYLVLANANREAARFAVRPNYVDYDAAQPDYSPIIAHTFQALSGQLEFTPTGVIIISRLYIKTGWPCNPADIFKDPTKPKECDCQEAIKSPYTDTIAITPIEVPTYTYTWPETATVATRLDYEVLRTELITTNLIHNCNLMNRTPEAGPQIEDVIYVEFFYWQYQLVGFPGWNNPLLNPVPMWAHSSFRRITQR